MLLYDTDISVCMDNCKINKSYQRLVGGLLDLVMYSLWMVRNLWSGGLCSCIFPPVTSLKLIIMFKFHFCALQGLCLGLITPEYVVTPSGVYILLSPFVLKAMLLTFSVSTLCALLLNSCCDLCIVLLFSRQSL